MPFVSAVPRAYAAAPVTVPVVTAPTDGGVAGSIETLSATSSAESVLFNVNGSPIGSPVAVENGAASTTWETFGLDQLASYVVTATDCNADGCGAESAPVTVTVDNDAPVLSVPIDGQIVGPDATLSATATGGAVAFSIDGVQVGVDTTAPFTFAATALGEGVHSAFVQGCDTTGTACAGPVSTTVAFTVKVLHPSINSISPSLFSPNGDGRRDTTTVTFSLLDVESVSYQIVRDATGLVVRSRALGSLAAGSHSFVWQGLDSSSLRVPDGSYTVAILASSVLSGGGRAHGLAQRQVRVDDTAPSLSSVTGANTKFYPYPDGYGDAFKPTITVNDAATLSLYVSTLSGRLVRHLSAHHSAAGHFSFSWDGKNSAGTRVGAATYLFSFTAEDSAGNRRSTGKYRVYVSSQHLVARSATLTLDGDRGRISTSNQSCTQYSYQLSEFAHGVWLANVCDPSVNFEAIFADYSFTVPAAVRYNSIRVQSYGNTISAPERIAALIYSPKSARWGSAGAVQLNRSYTNAWTTYGSVAAAGLVSSGRGVKISIGVPDSDSPEDYDIGSARIVVSYDVLG